MLRTVSAPVPVFVSTEDEAKKMLESLFRYPLIAVDTETTGLNIVSDKVLYMGLAWEGGRAVIPSQLVPIFEPILGALDVICVGHNIKFDAHMLENSGCRLRGMHDTLTMSVMDDTDRPSNSLKYVASTILGEGAISYKSPFNRKTKTVDDFIKEYGVEAISDYASLDAWATLQIYHKLKENLSAKRGRDTTLWDLFLAEEVPYTEVLYSCERRGFQLDFDSLKKSARAATRTCEVLEKKFNKLCGKPINIGSPQQVAELFFNVLGKEPTKMTKKGGKPSVDIEVIGEWANEGDPLAKILVEYRKTIKLLGTYLEGLTDRSDNLGKVHTTLNQGGTVTGRISSSNPNLTNIPRPGNDRYGIRECFIASKGMVLIDNDYCICKGERVFSSKGLCKIEDLKVGDKVYDEYGKGKKIYRKSLSKSERCREFVTESGYSLKCTSIHKLRHINSSGDYVWKRAGDLRIGDWVPIQPSKLVKKVNNFPAITFKHGNNNKNIIVPKTPNRDFTELLGYLIGDGGISGNRYIKCVACDKDKELFVHLITICKEIFSVIPSTKSYRGVNEFTIGSKPLVLWFQDIGFSKESVPEWLWSSGKISVSAFLRGLFEADGSISHTYLHITLAAKSGRLIRDVQLLLLGLGIRSKIRHQKTSYKSSVYPDKEYWTYIITIRSAYFKRFAKTIGFISIRKNKILLNCLEKLGKNIKDIYPNLKERLRKIKLSGSTYKLLHNVYSNPKRNITRQILIRLKKENPEIYNRLNVSIMIDTKQFYEQITEIKDIGILPVYDIEVPNGRTYIANGFVTHNSQLEMTIIADFAQDRGMIDIINSRGSIHAYTTELMFGIPYADVVKVENKERDDLTEEDKKLLELRVDAKTIGFALLYGEGPRRLAATLGCTEDEAKSKISRYFDAKPEIHKFIGYCSTMAESVGYVKSLSGRWRMMPLAMSRNYGIAKAESRKACNSIIQGSAADITRKAMLNCYDNKILKSIGVHMLLQIHDEIIFECPQEPDLVEAAKVEIKKEMESPYQELLDVHLRADPSVGKNWKEAK